MKDHNDRIAGRIAGLILALCALMGACSTMAGRKIITELPEHSQGH